MKAGWSLLVVLAWTAGCGGGTVISAPLQLGDPVPGLTPAERLAFDRGQTVFEHRFARSEGHGPDFNVSSCRSCHELPVVGGSSPRYRNFVIARNANSTNFFEGDQLVARNFSYTRTQREPITGAAIVAQRNTPPLFGVGRFTRIQDSFILANEDPLDANADGISGRANRKGIEVGRFGYKGQESELEGFVRGPLFNHMGITTNPLNVGARLAQVGQPDDPTVDNDGVPDPEMPMQDLADMIFWMENLAGPQPQPMDDQGIRGEQLFNSLGCAKCHIKSLGPVENLFSDLLLHDMGAGLADGITMGIANGAEFRTQPLWGLRHHAPYLHDGRADTIEEAVLAHGGEAQAARDGYNNLSPADKAAALKFLEAR